VAQDDPTVGEHRRQNPQTVRRLQQGIEELRSSDLGAFFGQPAGQGFFHKDQYGQEVFTVPGSEWATQALTGVPVPLVGNVQGLSVGTEFFPRSGRWRRSRWRGRWRSCTSTQQTPFGRLGEVLFPYGPPKNFNDLMNYTPSWFQKGVRCTTGRRRRIRCGRSTTPSSTSSATG
jgi:hypothetical protein